MSARVDRMKKALADMDAAPDAAGRAVARETASRDYGQATDAEKDQIFPNRAHGRP